MCKTTARVRVPSALGQVLSAAGLARSQRPGSSAGARPAAAGRQWEEAAKPKPAPPPPHADKGAGKQVDKDSKKKVGFEVVDDSDSEHSGIGTDESEGDEDVDEWTGSLFSRCSKAESISVLPVLAAAAAHALDLPDPPTVSDKMACLSGALNAACSTLGI